jgi:hypothetical protein
VGAIVSYSSKHSDDFVHQEQDRYTKDAISECNYLFLLLCIAYLWQPNINAKEYAYALMDGSNDDDRNDNNRFTIGCDLELTASTFTIPSAIDDDNYDNKNSKNHSGINSKYEVSSRRELRSDHNNS